MDRNTAITALLFAVTVIFAGCRDISPAQSTVSSSAQAAAVQSQMSSGTEDDEKHTDNSSAYCTVNNNVPFFYECEITAEPYQSYSELDAFGRCGPASAVVGKETIPTEERGKIGMIKPSGWHTVKYNGIVEGNYLYNRCHLIGYQLSGENDNRKNLITGTRFMNVSGMLSFENMVYDYIMKSGNHVIYRVTPKFYKDDLLAEGVLMEARSVEDNGEGICFCVFCYNVQPGITIDYRTGESKEYDGTPLIVPEAAVSVPEESSSSDDDASVDTSSDEQTDLVSETAAEESEGSPTAPEIDENEKREYIVNISSKRFHLPDCPSINDIKEKNKRAYLGTKAELEENGYSPCQRCFPQE